MRYTDFCVSLRVGKGFCTATCMYNIINHKSFDSWFPFFLVFGIAVNAIALFTSVMDQDSALYAAIAKTMMQSGDWLNMMNFGYDWLDKPHLPFWITALSFSVFGVSAFACKLPSCLVCLWGVFYLYKLAELFYNKRVAQIASVIYLTSLHVILSNFDVRAEGYLTTFIIAGIYFLYKIYKSGRWRNIVLAALFCAAAVMTKGTFVLLTLLGGFLIYWMLTNQWRQFIQWRWWLVLLLTFLFITPELYCLYAQFDLHPEKTVYGQQHVSGIRFFFWDSQFGRFFNTGPIRGKGDPSFFIHTTLWAFLPWSAALAAGVIAFLKRVKQQWNKEIMILVWSATLTFVLFSLSKFQLPHYIVILCPHFSIFVAAWLISLRKESVTRALTATVQAMIALLIAVTGWLIIYFPFFNGWFIAVASLTVGLALTGFRKAGQLNRFLWCGVCFSFLCSVFFATFLYGTLMQYDAGMNAARWINHHHPHEKVVMMDCKNSSLSFYLQSTSKAQEQITGADVASQDQSFLLFCPLSSLSKIDNQKITVKLLKEFDYFRITKLTAKFLSSKSRPAEIEKYVVARCSPQINSSD